MNLDEFTQITLAIASESGIAAYAPTIIAREQVQVVQGIPEGYDHREAIQEVILQAGMQNEEFYFGVRSGSQEITTGHHFEGCTSFVRILGLTQGFRLAPTESCGWWRLDGSAEGSATQH
jgi:hypothetical protein